jgi:hypothetical protein
MTEYSFLSTPFKDLIFGSGLSDFRKIDEVIKYRHPTYGLRSSPRDKGVVCANYISH